MTQNTHTICKALPSLRFSIVNSINLLSNASLLQHIANSYQLCYISLFLGCCNCNCIVSMMLHLFSNIVINIKVDVFQRIAAANRNFKMWLTYCSKNIVKKHHPPQLRIHLAKKTNVFFFHFHDIFCLKCRILPFKFL